MAKKFSFKLVWKALKAAFKGFSEDKVTKISASLAYYTVFSMAPLLIVIIYLCSIFLGREAVEGTIYTHIQGFIGAESAKQIQEIIKNASISGKGGLAAVIGVITLLIGATSVFGEIQDSINGIWGLKPKPKVGFMKLLKNRLLSFGLIGSLGFLLLVSLGVTAFVEAVGNRLLRAFPDITVVLIYIINLVLTLSVTTVLFAIIFKVLPDAKFKWKNIWPGAIATSLLFMLGKFAISFYIAKSQVASTYGSAGSMIVLLLWVYYSAIILYFGAEFTKSYALQRGAKIIPNHYAEWNKEPVVPGAETKEKPPTAEPGLEQKQTRKSEESKHHQLIPDHSHPQPVQRPATAHHNKKKETGMGTVLLAFTLYMINSMAGKTSKS